MSAFVQEFENIWDDCDRFWEHFWCRKGFKWFQKLFENPEVNILKTLLDSMASPALRNENGPQWTPLHAAALQEEGKACMLLMEGRANPLEKDTEGISAEKSTRSNIVPICSNVHECSMLETRPLACSIFQYRSHFVLFFFVWGSCFWFCIPLLLPLPPPPPCQTQFCHTSSFTHKTLSHPSLSHTTLSHPSLSHTTLSHPSLSHTTLSHTIFSTQLCHTPLCHTTSFTHNFITQLFTYNFFNFSILHHLLCLSFLSRPATTFFLLIGRSWLVGLSGPLILFAVFFVCLLDYISFTGDRCWFHSQTKWCFHPTHFLRPSPAACEAHSLAII